MRTRHSIGGRSSGLLWLGVLGGLALISALAYILLVVVPEQQSVRVAQEQRARTIATAEAQTAEIERAYAAGIAFAVAQDWEKAAEQFTKVVTIDPGYKDTSNRLTEVRSRGRVQAEADNQATATAQVKAMEAAKKEDQARATAEAQKTAIAQANQAVATAQAKAAEAGKKEDQARATAEAQKTAIAQANQAAATARAMATDAAIARQTTPIPPSQPNSKNDKPPITSPSDSPTQFIRDYYAAINARRYDLSWARLSDNFKDRVHCCNADGSYQYGAYVNWWNTIARVDVLSASEQNWGSSAVVVATIRYRTTSGRISDATTTFTLVANGNTWLIDLTSTP